MSLPKATSLLCAKYLTMIKQNGHGIEAMDRFNLYKSFGPSRLDLPIYNNTDHSHFESDLYYKNQILNFKKADYVLGWLAILTVEFILPKWEVIQYQLPEGFEQASSTTNIIELVKKILLRKIEIDENLFDSFGDYEIGLNIEEWVTYEVSCVYFSAFFALEVILFGGQSLNDSFPFNNDTFRSRPDFVLEALKAHSAIDRNPPGALFSETKIKPIEYDLQKQLEFWEWWLTEAIPQAWELAHQSANQ